MDAVKDWIEYAAHNSQALTYLVPYAGRIQSIVNLAQTWLYPLIQRTMEKPDLATIALLLVIVLVSLKILDMLWQSVKFWFNMAYKVAFWGGLATAGFWIWTRGPDGVVDDIQHWANVWSDKYEYWTDQDRLVKLARQQQVGYERARNGWF